MPQLAGHEGIVPMVALGFGLAMLPDVVIDNNPISKDVSRLNFRQSQSRQFDLGRLCAKKKFSESPNSCILGDVRLK